MSHGNVWLNHCGSCGKYRYVSLVCIGGAWLYLCGSCLRTYQPRTNSHE